MGQGEGRRCARVVVEIALKEDRRAARGDANLMPRILAAVEARATLGEISDTLRAVFGMHQETFSV